MLQIATATKVRIAILFVLCATLIIIGVTNGPSVAISILSPATVMFCVYALIADWRTR